MYMHNYILNERSMYMYEFKYKYMYIFSIIALSNLWFTIFSQYFRLHFRHLCVTRFSFYITTLTFIFIFFSIQTPIINFSPTCILTRTYIIRPCEEFYFICAFNICNFFDLRIHFSLYV